MSSCILPLVHVAFGGRALDALLLVCGEGRKESLFSGDALLLVCGDVHASVVGRRSSVVSLDSYSVYVF